MSIFATETKDIKIQDVNFVLTKMTYDQQLTIAAMHEDKRFHDAAFAILKFSIKSWDAPEKLEPGVLKNLSAEVAAELTKAILSFNNLGSEERKN